MALHCARQANANGFCESFNGRMRDELLNESLFFGLDHARSAIADFNIVRPHSSLGYQTPVAHAGGPHPGPSAAQDEGSAPAPVAQPAPNGVTETVEAPIAAGCSSVAGHSRSDGSRKPVIEAADSDIPRTGAP